jgi:hypothetical protein
MRSEVVRATEIMKIVSFWVMVMCSVMGGKQHYRGTCFHLQGRRVYLFNYPEDESISFLQNKYFF